MADPNKPSKRVGLAGIVDNAARNRQRNLNRELGDNLQTRKLGGKLKNKPQGSNKPKQ